MTFVYVDTETTGLDPSRHEVWEMAFALEDGPVRVMTVPHSLRNADPTALRINRYQTRSILGEMLDSWRYRMLDIEAYAMGAFAWPEPKGLLSIAEAINEADIGHEVVLPNHSAHTDVECLRQCHRALRDLYEVTT